MQWKLRDIVVAAMLAVVCGAIYLGGDIAYNFVPQGVNPILLALFNGIWWIAAGIVPYIVRRPGAALLAESVGGLVEFLLGSPYGIQALTIGIAQGLGVELGFAIGGYRRYGWGFMLFATALGGIGNYIYSYFYYGVNAYSAALQVGYVIASMVSGMILSGVLSKIVGDALRRTGVLRNFAIAQAEDGHAY